MSDYYDAVVADNPVEFWPMTQTGTTLDSNGSGGHALTANGGAAVVTGRDGNGRGFDGVDDYLISSTAVADFTAQTNYSVEAWFKITSTDTNGTDFRTVCRRDGTGAWLMRVAGSTSGIQQGAVQAYFQGKLMSSGSTRFDDGNWHQMVVTKSNTTYKLYVDKVEYTTTSGTVGAAVGASQGFVVGNAGGSGGSEKFKGSIDSVSIYHTALTTTRINAHYDAAGDDTVILDTPNATANIVTPSVGIDVATNLSTLTASADVGTTTTAETADGLTYVDVPSVSSYQVNMSTGSLGTAGTTSAQVTSTWSVYNRFDLPPEVLAGAVFRAEFHYYGTAQSSPVGLTARQMLDFNNSFPHASTLGTAQDIDTGTGAHVESFYDTDPANYEGVLMQITSGTYTIAGYTNSTVENRPFLRIAYVASVVDVDFTLDTPTASYTSNDAIAEITNPTNVEVTLTTVSASAQANDAGFAEIRTAVLYPTSDLHRLQGTETWVNNTNYLEINYNPATPASSVFVATGTTAQKDIINSILENCDFPFDALQSSINGAGGQNYINVQFGELDGEGGVGVLGTYNDITRTITLDTSLEPFGTLLAGAVLMHEIGHVVDHFYLTNDMRVTIWNIMQPGTTNDLADGTSVINGINIKNGYGWLGYGDYFDFRVGEAYANAFVEAYSNYSTATYNFDLAATDDVCDAVRTAITPTMSDTRGPFPTRTACARMYFAPLPSAIVTGVVESVTLRLNVILNSIGGNFNVRTMDPTGRIAYVSDYVQTTLPTGINNIDLTDEFDPKEFSIVHVGPMKEGASRLLRMTSMDGGNTSTEPRLTVRYAVSQGATVVDLDTPAVGTSSADVTVEVEVSPSVTVDVGTAAALANGLDASVVLKVDISLSDTDTVMLGAYDPDIELNNTVDMGMDTVRNFARAIPLTDVNGEPIVASEEEDPYFVTTMNTLEGGTQRVFGGGYVGVPIGLSEWFRMDKLVNGVFIDRAVETDNLGDPDFTAAANLRPSAGVTVGLFEGPEGRHNIHFNGDSWATVGNAVDVDLPTEANVEFTFRTERSTQFLLGGMARNLIGGDVGGFVPAELWMVDGYLEARFWPRIGGTYLDRPPVTMRGTHKLDDGQWHHVVFQTSYQNIVGVTQNNPDFGFASEFFVDGKLDLRRRRGPVPVMRVSKVAGRDEDYYWVNTGTYPMPDIPQSQWFLGDMTELVMRESRTINEDQIHDQRDAMFGIYPVKPETPKVSIKTAEASVKGNKPRHLVLDFGIYGGDTTLDTDNQMFEVYEDMRYDVAEISMEARNMRSIGMSFPGWGTNPGDDTGLTQRFVYNVRFKPGTTEQWTDEVSDNYRLIDLENDVNMDDFDVISISNFPGSQNAWTIYDVVDAYNQNPKIPMRVQVENLLAQVREQVTLHGKSLFLNDPMSTIALGIVDKVDYVPSFVETATFDNRLGADVGHIDWHAYVVDPFNGGTPWVPYADQSGSSGKSGFTTTNRNRAARYTDLHSNIKQKVVNLVEGLTTMPGYILEDYIIWNDVNPMATPPEHQSMDWADRSAGMYMGDEFYMISEHDEDIPYGFAATPVSHIKVGRAVTTFAPVWYYTPSAERMLEDPQFVDNPSGGELRTRDADLAYGNPYYNHAVSIVVEPGDAWNGQAVTGKVYVNFTETFTHRADLWDEFSIFVKNGEKVPPPDGVVLPHDQWPTLISGGIAIGQAVPIVGGGFWNITAEHMKYNYSTHYGSFTGSEIHLPTGSSPDWGWSSGGSRSGGGVDAGGAYAMAHFWSPIFKMKSVPTPTMAQRAVRWLIGATAGDGSSVNGAATATLSAQANDVTVETSRNETVDLSTARVEVESYSDADTISPDVSVAVPTVDVIVRANGIAEDIDMDTASVFVFVGETELQDYEIDWDSVLTLTMPKNSITLTLEDA